jgi:hypothetical protein
MTTWIEALKIWNGKREGKKYMIPRKGTEEHAQIMSIMKGQQNGKGLVQLGRKAKKEFNDNKELYKRTKKNLKEANNTYEATRPLQKKTINNLKRANSAVDKLSMVGLGQGQSGGEIINPNVDLITEINNLWTGLIGMGMNQTQKKKLKKRIEGGEIDLRDLSLVSRMSRDIMKTQNGGSLQKAVDFATNQPDKFVEFVNKIAQQGGGKKQKGGFLPAFVIPFIPAITTALGAFATGAAGAAGAAAVDAIIGDGVGLSKTQKKRLKKQQKGGLGWAEMTAVNEVLYPLQAKLPSLDSKTGKAVPPSTPFDFLNIKF